MEEMNVREDNDEFPNVIDHNKLSKLSSLFTSDSNKQLPNLKYVPVPQIYPKMSSSKTIIKNTQHIDESRSVKEQNILFATATNLYSLQDGSHKNEGKMMCCVTRHNLQDNFAFLIYKSSKQIFVQAAIRPNFLLEILPKNYISFTDEFGIRWSFHINGKKYEQFLKQIGICRAIATFSYNSSSSWVSQSLSLGEGKTAKPNDVVKVSKFEWDVDDYKKSSTYEKETESTSITLDKSADAWEMSLLGCQKNLHIIVLSLRSQVPAVNEEKLKIFVHELRVEQIIPCKATTSTADSAFTSTSELSKKDGKEGKPALASKATLISRMAKVGQPMFPSQPDLPVETETDLNDFRFLSRSRVESVASSIEEIDTSGSKMSNIKLGTFPVEPNSFQYNMVAPGSVVSYHPLPYQQMPHHSSPTNNASSEPILSLLLSETRSQNTDLRISLSKLTDKIDHVNSKVTSLENSRSKRSSSESSVDIKYDPEELLKRITALVEENKATNDQINGKNEKIDHLNSTLTNVMLKNQKLLEERTELIVKIGFSESKTTAEVEQLVTLEEEKSRLVASLTEAQLQIESLETQVKNAERETEKMTDRNSILKFDFTKMKNQIDREIFALQEKLLNCEQEKQSLSEQLEELGKQTYSSNRYSSEELELLRNQLKNKEIRIEEIEKEMNETRKVLMTKKDENKTMKMQMDRLTTQNEQLTADNKKQKTLRNEDYNRNQQMTEELKDKQFLIEQLREEIGRLRLQDSLIADKTEADETIAELKRRVFSFEEDASKRVDTPDIVKKIMNVVYKKLKALFQQTETYDGETILDRMLVVIRDTTLQYFETLAEEEIVTPIVKPNPLKEIAKVVLTVNREEHLDKSVSLRADCCTSTTDDQQSEETTSLGSYEILPNDDSDSRLSSTLTPEVVMGCNSAPKQQLLNPLTLGGGCGRFSQLHYRIGASSSAETPDEFGDNSSQEDESTLKSLSEASTNKNILPPNDFADADKKNDAKSTSSLVRSFMNF